MPQNGFVLQWPCSMPQATIAALHFASGAPRLGPVTALDLYVPF
jgi:hypothetical protein